MQDLYLTTTSLAALMADLDPLGLAVVGEDSIPRFASRADVAIDYIGQAQIPGTGEWDAEGNQVVAPEFYPYELANIRCSDELADAIREADFINGTVVLAEAPSSPVRQFAG